MPDSAFDAEEGGYGGVIDASGNLWSSPNGRANFSVVWLKPPVAFPVTTNDWKTLSVEGAAPYGIAIDPLHPYIWQTSDENVFRWHTNGTPVTNAQGNVMLHSHGGSHSQGLAVAADGHVWVAHEQHNGSTVGHLNTNGTLVGVVSLSNYGLWGEYFDNPNLTGGPVLAALEQAALDFTWTNGWPESPVPPNQFSARWTGVVSPTTAGQHVFHVHADAGAAVRLTVNGAVLIDNWAAPGTNAVALSGTNWLGTNVACDLTLEYAHIADGPWLNLSWTPPGATNREVIPAAQFQVSSHGPTGISIDADGKIWAGCWYSSTAVRINPNAGPRVVVDGVTNHVGWVDMVVQLGDGSWHTSPYNQAAKPYNYSDMTGFNVRVVNPGLQPLAGYWKVVEDSGNAGQLWNKVSWTAALTNGCSVEVHVRAADERTDLGSAVFVPVTNDVFFPAVRGRYIEVRVGMTRDDASKEPVLYDLTLYGTSSGFAGDFFLYDVWADEGGDGVFWTDLVGAEPIGYQWYRMYPWETNWVQVAGATNSYFVVTNVDSWVELTRAMVFVTNGSGESLWLGPAYLVMDPAEMRIPATNYPSGQGLATRYPATIDVFGQPTNLNNVTVTLSGLSHTRSADLNILLVSPSDKKIMLMSNVGGTNGVAGSTLSFRQNWSLPPTSDAIPSWQTLYYGPSNYGQQSQLPGAPSGPYSIRLDDLNGDNPNGTWKLFIYDNVQPGGVGQLSGSWWLDFTFQ
jgi:sugar lactone lactonase YvrE